jgi:hypothetical protein
LISSCCENQRTNVDIVIKYVSNNINGKVVMVLMMMMTTTATTAAAAVLLQLSFRNMLTFLRNLVQVILGQKKKLCRGITVQYMGKERITRGYWRATRW